MHFDYVMSLSVLYFAAWFFDAAYLIDKICGWVMFQQLID